MEFIFMILLGVIAALLLLVVYLLARTPVTPQPAVVVMPPAVENSGCGAATLGVLVAAGAVVFAIVYGLPIF